MCSHYPRRPDSDGHPRLPAVALDVDTVYDLEVRRHCPHAEAVSTLFHAVAKFGREATDRAETDKVNRALDDKLARQKAKTSRWVSLRNRERIPPDQATRLGESPAANHTL